MVNDIQALLRLFQDHVPDSETHSWVSEIANDRKSWVKAHDLFGRVRSRNLEAIDKKDSIRQAQYCFEEICLKSLYNESGKPAPAPFDSDSPHWIIKNAITLARYLGIPDSEVINIIAPRRKIA